MNNEAELLEVVKAARAVLGGKCPQCDGWGEVSDGFELVPCRCFGDYRYEPTKPQRTALREALANLDRKNP